MAALAAVEVVAAFHLLQQTRRRGASIPSAPRRLRILAAAVMSLIRVRSENTDLEGLAHLIQLAMFVLRVRIYVYIYDKFSKVVVDFSSIRGQKLFGWMLIFNLF